MDPKCLYKRKEITSKEEEGKGSQERLEDDTLLVLKTEKRAISQGIH